MCVNNCNYVYKHRVHGRLNAIKYPWILYHKYVQYIRKNGENDSLVLYELLLL